MKKLLLISTLLFASYLSQGQINLDTLKQRDSIIYSIIEDWANVPYRFGGNDKRGVDCSGFSLMIYKARYDVEIPRIAKEQYNICTRVKKSELKTGDLIFFRTKGRSRWHVGVYLMDGYFIHSANRRDGIKISSLSSPYYTRAYLSGGRI